MTHSRLGLFLAVAAALTLIGALACTREVLVEMGRR